MIKKLMWIVSIIALAGTGIALQFLPDSVPMHYDMAGNIDRWGSKYEQFIFPALIIVISLFWTLFIRYFEKKASRSTDEKTIAEAGSNAKILSIVGLAMAVMFTIMHAFFLYGSYVEAGNNATSASVNTGKITFILLGVMMIIIGNFMTKTRINGAVGLRVSWSMYNDNTWRKSNFFAAVLIMITGVLIIIVSVFIDNNPVLGAVTVGLIVLCAILSVIYAHKVYVREIEAEKNSNLTKM